MKIATKSYKRDNVAGFMQQIISELLTTGCSLLW